jgi:hypothetical protein
MGTETKNFLLKECHPVNTYNDNFSNKFIILAVKNILL